MNIPKFRAWHKSTNTMVYFDPAANPNDQYQALHLWRLIGGIHEEGENLLMQSTGLTDKNGAEIFEGDIVRTVYDNDKTTSANHTVKWFGDTSYPAFDLYPPYCEESNSFSSITCDSENITIEVIGNIHANADLLNDPN